MAKVQEKNGNRSFYPSAKSRTEPKMFSSGVIFRDGSASDAQKFIAIPEQKFCFFAGPFTPRLKVRLGKSSKKFSKSTFLPLLQKS